MTLEPGVTFHLETKGGYQETWGPLTDPTAETLTVCALKMLDLAGVDYKLLVDMTDAITRDLDENQPSADPGEDKESSPEPPGLSVTLSPASRSTSKERRASRRTHLQPNPEPSNSPDVSPAKNPARVRAALARKRDSSGHFAPASTTTYAHRGESDRAEPT